MEKTILFDGKEVRMRASALVPRYYRFKFGRDIVVDLRKLSEKMFKGYQDGGEDEGFSAMDLTIFEDVAYTMAKQADPSIPETPEEWLDSFSIFGIYEILPEILLLWEESKQTTAVQKKK